MKEDRFEIVLTGKFLAKFLPLFASIFFGSAADWRRLKYKVRTTLFSPQNSRPRSRRGQLKRRRTHRGQHASREVLVLQ